ncbi:phage protein Gp27 family protein [Bartonella sp. AP152HLJHH]|uniref:phage protein Gp27 family protein n=1 Tax=Bartonella sp. AP152HLJHH TaxID=3243469 RepID=UPI0035D106B9
MRKVGRGRLTAIDLLPQACDQIIAAAAEALNGREKTQKAIYDEFKAALKALKKEMGLSFSIPSFSSFNRYSLRLAVMSRRLEQTREIAASLSQRFDAKASDNITLLTAAAIKELIFSTLSSGKNLSPKAAQELANALKGVLAAEHLSTTRRQRLEKDFTTKASKAVDVAAAAAGLSEETARAIRAQVLGVKNG